MKNFVCIVIIIVYGCNSSKDLFLKQEKIPTTDEIEPEIWSSVDSIYTLNIVSSKPKFATDIRATWLALICKDTITSDSTIYYLFNPGHSFRIENNYFSSLQKEVVSQQESLEGWYRKSKGNFVSLDSMNRVLIFKNKKFYYETKKNHFKVVGKTLFFNKEMEKQSNKLNYCDIGLFKLQQNKLVKISANIEDVFKYQDGVFYIPSPGSATKYCFNINNLIDKLEKEKLPDKVSIF